MDICTLCENEHKNHKFITYDSIMPDIDNIKNETIRDTNQKIYALKTIINGMITQLNQLNKNLDKYFEIFNDIITNFNNNKKNYSFLQNVNNMKKFNDNFMGNITEIIKDNNLKSKFISIIDLQANIDFKKMKKNIETPTINQMQIKADKNENKEDSNTNNEAENNIDKYENFNINKIQELQTFTTKNKIRKLLILKDRRILTLQEYFNEKGKCLHKLCVYSTTNGFVCDFNIDTDFTDNSHFYLLDDGNVIIEEGHCQIIKVNNNSIEEIWNGDKLSIKKRLLNNIFLVSRSEPKGEDSPKTIWAFLANTKFLEELYKYDSGKLIFYKSLNELYKKEKIQEICQINEKEFVFYVNQKGKIYGTNDYLIFYDIESDKKIKTLKVGRGENLYEMYLASEDNLIIKGENNIILIDVKNRIIKNECNYDIYPSEFFLINEKIFLYPTKDIIYQYEIENSNTIKLKGNKEINNSLISKYPGNKLVIYKKCTITIFGYNPDQ